MRGVRHKMVLIKREKEVGIIYCIWGVQIPLKVVTIVNKKYKLREDFFLKISNAVTKRSRITAHSCIQNYPLYCAQKKNENM